MDLSHQNMHHLKLISLISFLMDLVTIIFRVILVAIYRYFLLLNQNFAS
jgi:hypothetical protein